MFLAKHCDCLVLSPEYPLAPEHPFPAALDSVESFIAWLLRSQPGVRIALGGFSAGGTLALGAAQGFLGQLRAVVAFFPILDFSRSSLFWGFASADPHRRSVYCEAYLLATSATPAALTHPRLSPRYADPATLPRAVVLVVPEVSPSPLPDSRTCSYLGQ
jgi:acetyl esterase/lipase